MPSTVAYPTPSRSSRCANVRAMNGFKMSMRMTRLAPRTEREWSHRLSPMTIPTKDDTMSQNTATSSAPLSHAPALVHRPMKMKPRDPTLHLTRLRAYASPVHTLFQMKRPSAPRSGVNAAAVTPIASVCEDTMSASPRPRARTRPRRGGAPDLQSVACRRSDGWSRGGPLGLLRYAGVRRARRAGFDGRSSCGDATPTRAYMRRHAAALGCASRFTVDVSAETKFCDC